MRTWRISSIWLQKGVASSRSPYVGSRHLPLWHASDHRHPSRTKVLTTRPSHAPQVLLCVILVSLAISIIVFTIANLGSYLTVMIETYTSASSPCRLPHAIPHSVRSLPTAIPDTIPRAHPAPPLLIALSHSLSSHLTSSHSYLRDGEAAAAEWTAEETSNATAIALTCTASDQALLANLTDYVGFVTDVYDEVRVAFSRNDTDAALAELSQSDTIEMAIAVMNCWLNTFLTVFTSAMTVILNLVITSTVDGLARFSRFATYTEQNMGVVLAIAIAQFINTALVVFIVNHATGIAGVPEGMTNPFPQVHMNMEHPMHACACHSALSLARLLLQQENHLCLFGSDPLDINATTEVASANPHRSAPLRAMSVLLTAPYPLTTTVPSLARL